MTRMTVEIDDEALADAARVLGTSTTQGTVNAALREISARLGRISALEELTAMGRRGDYDEFVGNPGAYRSEKTFLGRETGGNHPER